MWWIRSGWIAASLLGAGSALAADLDPRAVAEGRGWIAGGAPLAGAIALHDAVVAAPDDPEAEAVAREALAAAGDTLDEWLLLDLAWLLPDDPDLGNRVAIHQANRALNDGDSEAAIARLERATRGPTLAAARRYQGDLLRADGKLKSALMAYREALQAVAWVRPLDVSGAPGTVAAVGADPDPDAAANGELALIEVARVYVRIGRLQNAASFYDQVESADPEIAAIAVVEGTWARLLADPDDPPPARALARATRDLPGAAVLRAHLEADPDRRVAALEDAATDLRALAADLGAAAEAPDPLAAARRIDRALPERVARDPMVWRGAALIAAIDAERPTAPPDARARLDAERAAAADRVHRVAMARLNERAYDADRWAVGAHALAVGAAAVDALSWLPRPESGEAQAPSRIDGQVDSPPGPGRRGDRPSAGALIQAGEGP